MTNLPADLVEVGHVMSAFGVQGWIKIRPYTTDADTLVSAKKWWFRPKRVGPRQEAYRAFALEIQQSRPHSDTIIALPKGYTNRDQALELRGHTVWVSRSGFPPTAQDEYYWVDLLNCYVYGVALNDTQYVSGSDNDAVLLGRVSHVFDNGAHAVLVVDQGEVNAKGEFTPKLDQRNRPKQHLVPFVQAFVVQVDLDNQVIKTSWPADF